jgi:3-hydroxyisobutyrate dehydrogenase-like beta-hydroxyacid dehydrogenase
MAAAQAEIIFSMVRDDEAAQSVWLDAHTGALSAMRRGAVAIECSTVSRAWANHLHDACRQAGHGCLDAPVIGSRPKADAGELVFVTGGDEGVLRRVEPVLLAMGSKVHHAGAGGAGSTLKLVINALFGIQVAALAELIGLLGPDDLGKAMEIFADSPAASPAIKTILAGMLAGDYTPVFPLELAEKDFGYAQSLAKADELVPLVSATRSVLRQAMARGWEHDNMTGLARLYH